MVVAALLIVAAGCAARTVEDYAEYTELRDQRDQLAADLEQLRGDGEAAGSSPEGVEQSYVALLEVDLVGRLGISGDDAGCVAGEIAGEAGLREAYQTLIGPERTTAEPDQLAIDQVTQVLEGCGLGVEAQPASEPEEAPADSADLLDEVLGDVVVTGVALPRFDDQSSIDPAIGVTLPVVTGEDYTGEAVRIDPAADGPTMVVVVSHWCPYCNAELPEILELDASGRIPDGVNVVAVSSGVNPNAVNFPPTEWFADLGWDLPVLADGLDDDRRFTASTAYGTSGVPFVVLADADGIVIDRWAGDRPIDDLEQALAQLS